LIQDAVVRNLEIVGEAARRVSPALREQTPGFLGARWPGCETSLLAITSGVDLDPFGTSWRLNCPQRGLGSSSSWTNSKTATIPAE